MTPAIDRNTIYIQTYRKAILRSLFARTVDMILKPYMGKMGVHPLIFNWGQFDILVGFA